MNQYLKFTVTLLIFIVILGTAQWFYNYSVEPDYTTRFCWFIYGLTAGMTALIHYYLIYTGGKDPKVFIRTFMAASTIKMFIYLGVLVVIAFRNKVGAAPFIGHFGVYYFLFTAFEITVLYRHLRRQQSPRSGIQ